MLLISQAALRQVISSDKLLHCHGLATVLLPQLGTLRLECHSKLVHSSVICSASGNDNTGSTGDSEAEAASLPENATAAQMRQWADRMLLRRAAGGPDEGASEQTKMQDAAAASTAREGGYEEAAAARVDSPASMPAEQEGLAGASGALPKKAAQEARDQGEAQPGAAPPPPVSPNTSAWRRFVDERMGKVAESGQPGTSWATRARLDAEVAGSEQPSSSSTPQTVEEILGIQDPMRELNRLLPKHARRHGLDQTGFIRQQADSPEQLPFKATAGATESFAPPEPLPRRLTVIEPPMDVHANAATGYSQLGRPNQTREELEAEAAEALRSTGPNGRRLLQGLATESRRLHPTRAFFPGQLYEPEELVSSSNLPWRKHSIDSGKKATNRTVRAEADFRNQAFLNRFITELGRLPPKRVTRLQQKTHRHLCRTIKLARNMALLPIDAQLSREYLQRVGGAGLDQARAEGLVEVNPSVPTRESREAMLARRGPREGGPGQRSLFSREPRAGGFREGTRSGSASFGVRPG